MKQVEENSFLHFKLITFDDVYRCQLQWFSKVCFYIFFFSVSSLSKINPVIENNFKLNLKNNSKRENASDRLLPLSMLLSVTVKSDIKTTVRA